MRMTRLALLTALVFLAALLGAVPGQAQIGVGVSLGRIVVDDPLQPGQIYRLPSLGVINTGKEMSKYEVEVTYHQDQKQMRPPKQWVDFDPQAFTLEPGKSQSVGITLYVPTNARPGDYFAYLEAHPVIERTGFAVGVAAATKLYFSVKPANWLAAVRARVRSFVEINAPYSYIIPGVLAIIGVVFLFCRLFSVRLRIERRQ